MFSRFERGVLGVPGLDGAGSLGHLIDLEDAGVVADDEVQTTRFFITARA
jgi:hypothetical protein